MLILFLWYALGASVAVLSVAREDWTPSAVSSTSTNTNEETQKMSVWVKGAQKDDGLGSFQQSQADWIRQYMEQQEEVCWQNGLAICFRCYQLNYQFGSLVLNGLLFFRHNKLNYQVGTLTFNELLYFGHYKLNYWFNDSVMLLVGKKAKVLRRYLVMALFFG